MARNRRGQQQEKDPRPVAVDDFIYDEPEDSGEEIASDTPDEAVRKLRGRPKEEADEKPGAPDDGDAPLEEPVKPNKRKVYSSGVILDENLQPVGKVRKRHPFLRGLILTLITLVLLFTAGSYILSRLTGFSFLKAPEDAVSAAVTPVQSFFSGITESIAGYFRSMKLRSNIENEYNALRAENEQLVYKAMLADELQHTLSQYEDLIDEIKANENMKPIVATVVGKSDSNYFSTLTINKGKKHGVEDYMAVTISGALVGYTENTQEEKATVRTIIDSNASIAALIQSSRDQGTVRGTLGIDGTPMCRMYYLPDDNLPRPGDLVVTSGVGLSFPKGIPIGVVRESTRGMDANKQYIILEPKVDFQHLEYVIVLLYKPKAGAIEGRENGKTNLDLVPLESARPSPVVPEIAASLFDTPTPAASVSPEATGTPLPEGVTPSPLPEGVTPNALPPDSVTPAAAESPTPESTDTPSPTPTRTPEPTPDETPLEYQEVNLHNDPTPTPTPTPQPTPTPYFTPDPNNMTYDDEEDI